MQHPFDGVLPEPTHHTDAESSPPHAEPATATSTSTLRSGAKLDERGWTRRGFVRMATVMGAFTSLMAGAATAQQPDPNQDAQRESERRRRDGQLPSSPRSDRRQNEPTVQRDHNQSHREDADNHRRTESSRDRERQDQRSRDREDDEWYDRLDSYFSDRQLWGPRYDQRRRGGYTTQALYEEGGRGYRPGYDPWGRGRYTTQALYEEGGRGGWYRYDRDRYRWDDRYDGGQRQRGNRDRDDRRYTTFALGEEG